jgi:adenosylcobyric acid synthase
MGETSPADGIEAAPLVRFADGQTDGCRVDDKCMGCYIHGILDNPAFIDRLLAPYGDKLTEAATSFDYHAYKEQQYDRLADHVRKYVDVPLLYDILRGKR